MNKSYKRGYAFENSLKKKLEAKGYYVVRSAGSKGVFDLIAIKEGKVYGIQCKIGYSIHEKELIRIVDTAKRFGIYPVVAFKDGRKIKLFIVKENKSVSIDEFA